MLIDFDPEKDRANREKHGVPLAFGARIFEDSVHVVLPSMRQIDGEDRYKAVGRGGQALDGDSCSPRGSGQADFCEEEQCR